MSIRLRVTLATVALAALAVGAADVTTFVLLRGYFDRRADASVRQVARTAVDALRRGQALRLSTFAGTDRLVLVEVRSAQGRVLERLGTSEAADVRLPSDLLLHPGRPQQIEAPHHRGPAFQVIAVPAAGGTVVAAVSLRNEVGTLAHLFRLNFAVGGIVLALLAVVAAIVLTRSLRPLRRIATTADAIAGGDLAARMPPAPIASHGNLLLPPPIAASIPMKLPDRFQRRAINVPAVAVTNTSPLPASAEADLQLAIECPVCHTGAAETT